MGPLSSGFGRMEHPAGAASRAGRRCLVYFDVREGGQGAASAQRGYYCMSIFVPQGSSLKNSVKMPLEPRRDLFSSAADASTVSQK
jgi:hypothetical protein